MKRNGILLLVALLVAGLTGAALSQDPQPPQGPPPGGPGGAPGQPGQPGQPGMGRGAPPPQPIVAALDLDRNGEISAEEIAKAAESLRTLDRNGDGKLTREEYLPPRPEFGNGPGGFLDRMMQFDTDGDGKLSAEELPERMRDRIEEFDGNGDGALDRTELDEMMRQRGGRRGGRGPGGEGGGGGRER